MVVDKGYSLLIERIRKSEHSQSAYKKYFNLFDRSEMIYECS